MNLFLVDDDPIIRAGIARIIEKSGEDYVVVGEASDGELALRAIREKEHIDLILTDIRMPIMNGLELIKEIRKFNTHTKIVVLSGFDDYKYVRNAFMDGAVDYLLKPIVKKDLLELIRKIKEQIETEAKEDAEGAGGVRRNKKFLYQLLHGRYDTSEAYQALIGALSLTTEVQCLLMVFKIAADSSEIHESGYYETLLEDSMIKLNNILSLDQKHRFFSYIENGCIVILAVAEAEMAERELINRTYLYIKNTPLQEQVTFIMGVSKTHQTLMDAKEMYDEAMLAAYGSFYEGVDEVIEFSQMKPYRTVTDGFEREREALREAYELCDYVKVKHETDHIYDMLYGASPDDVKRNIRLILDYLVLHVRDFKEALLDCGYDYEFFLSNVSTITELREKIYAGSKKMLEKMKEERGKRSKKRIELAKTYMEEHYMEPLTLNSVADYVELNASYFSNLFKRETGMNFSEYLLDVRIDKAKKLLMNPTNRVYEIGNMVGYDDAVSFGRAFKKKIGMSPKEYRNTVC